MDSDLDGSSTDRSEMGIFGVGHSVLWTLLSSTRQRRDVGPLTDLGATARLQLR